MSSGGAGMGSSAVAPPATRVAVATPNFGWSEFAHRPNSGSELDQGDNRSCQGKSAGVCTSVCTKMSVLLSRATMV